MVNFNRSCLAVMGKNDYTYEEMQGLFNGFIDVVEIVLRTEFNFNDDQLRRLGFAYSYICDKGLDSYLYVYGKKYKEDIAKINEVNIIKKLEGS